MSKRQKVVPTFGELVGGLDLLPKIGYTKLESAVGSVPCFMFWGLYLVHVKDLKTIAPQFCVVDNLDESGTIFILKDVRVTKPLVINAGFTPAVQSVAELKKKKWYHIGLYPDRLAVADAYDELRAFSSKVELILGVFPLQKLKIYTDDRVKEDDHVYMAILEARNKRDKK